MTPPLADLEPDGVSDTIDSRRASVEVNIEGKTGFLSSVGDVDKMAEDMISLLKNRDLLESFKMNALAHAKSFELKNILPKYNAIYQSL